MSERTRLGLYVIGAGLLLGLAGDALLRATPWGLNFTLWAGALVGATYALRRRAAGATAGGGGRGPSVEGRAFTGEGAWALPCVFVFAAAFAWRDSPALLALDGLAVLVLLSVLLLGGRGGRVARAGVTDYWLAGVASSVAAAFGPLLLGFSDVKWGELPRRGWTRQATAVLRGLLIAVPLLLLFGGLFAAADAAYASLVSRTLNIDPDVAVSHVCLTLFIAWVSAGYLRGLLLGRSGAGKDRSARVVLGFTADWATPQAPGGGPKTEASAGAPAGASAEASAGASARSAGAGESPNAGVPDVYWPQPPSVTELAEEGARPAPPSVVEEEARPAAPPPAAGQAEAVGAKANAATDVAGGVAGGVAGDAPGGVAGGVAGGAPAPAVGGGTSADAGPRMRLGVVEVGITLGLLNALFLSFVAVQLRYLFGGTDVVIESAGLTYSEYARRGFFELVWVAALVLPVLLAAHWLLRKERPAHERVFRLLAAGLLSMLFVVMASALWRMRLYQSEYGQTELRFYTTAFIGWLALVFVWFALTVLRGRRELFAFGALVAALAVLLTLNALNPSALIVRSNAALARERGTFDAAYATSLGADAVPALLEAAPGLGPAARAEVARYLLEEDWAEGGWRSWNLSRVRARRAVGEGGAVLRSWAEEGAEAPRGPS